METDVKPNVEFMLDFAPDTESWTAKHSDKIAQITPAILRKSHQRDIMMQE
ncbi:MAG: hypothetical protein K6F61_01320 [Clostridiales bacterium]|nr:hypothetical protein [Clostridiales bacterium]